LRQRQEEGYGGKETQALPSEQDLREEFTEPVGLSTYALAKALGVPLPRVNDIVREKRAISPEMAVLLSAYFGTSSAVRIGTTAEKEMRSVAMISALGIPACSQNRDGGLDAEHSDSISAELIEHHRARLWSQFIAAPHQGTISLSRN
jgi:addiction module HigA family antidote